MRENGMRQELMKKTTICCICFFVIAMGSIIYLSVHKVVTIEGVAQDEVAGETIATGNESHALAFQPGEADSSYLRIPLPEGCKASDITIENHYMDQELWIYVPGGNEDFYRENVLSGNHQMINAGSFDLVQGGIVLNLQLTGICECRTILENENLYISFLTPREVYDRIVVIDPAYGGREEGAVRNGLKEKNVVLAVARALKEKLDGEDIKVYYTRMDNIYEDESDRIILGNGAKADMYIRIETACGEASEEYGIRALYNGTYFIPGFGNIELADTLEREVTVSVSGKAQGLLEEPDPDSILYQLTIPAATIQVGYLSNAQEARLLSREDYIRRIADGIYQSIMTVYEMQEKNG